MYTSIVDCSCSALFLGVVLASIVNAFHFQVCVFFFRCYCPYLLLNVTVINTLVVFSFLLPYNFLRLLHYFFIQVDAAEFYVLVSSVVNVFCLSNEFLLILHV